MDIFTAHSSNQPLSAIIFSETEGGSNYTDRFQNTAYSCMAAACCTEARVQACGRRSALILTIAGGLLPVYDLFLLIIDSSSKELMLLLLMVGALLIAVPLLVYFMANLLSAINTDAIFSATHCTRNCPVFPLPYPVIVYWYSSTI